MSGCFKSRSVAFATILLAVPGLPFAQTPESGESMVPGIVSRLESDLAALQLFSFREELQVERRTRSGEISSRKQETSEVFHRDGTRMRRTIEDGHGSAPVTDEEPSIDLKNLASCFDFAPPAADPLPDRPAIRLDFTARGDCVTAPGRAARILGNLEGRLWIDPVGYELLRVEGHLRGPVAFGLGLLGKVETFDLEVERSPVGPGVFAMTRLEYRAQGRIFPARRFDLRNRRDRTSFQRLPEEELSNDATTPSRHRASDRDPDPQNRS